MADRCNEHGVYEPDEVFTLDRGIKGWRGCPTAEIELRDLGDHWIWSINFQLMQGDCWGRAQPLVDHERYRATGRDAALYCAKAALIVSLSELSKEPGDARRIMVWLDSLNPAQMDLFGAMA